MATCLESKGDQGGGVIRGLVPFTVQQKERDHVTFILVPYIWDIWETFRLQRVAPPCLIHPGDRALVRPEDVSWWNTVSLHDLKLFYMSDNALRIALFLKLSDQGLPSAEAAKKVRLTFLHFYLTPEERSHENFQLGADDAKLPYALKDRINRAAVRRVINKQAVEQSSSINALVRQLIRSGRI